MASQQDHNSPASLDPTSSSSLKQSDHSFPAPYIIQPQNFPNHTHTWIFLHGLGSNGPKFGDELLAAQVASGFTLRDIFPEMKFIFPTARRSRSTIFKRAKVNQWFNFSSFDKDLNRDELAVDGLEETSLYIKHLIEEEVTTHGIPGRNIVLAGLSQGFAASAYSLLTMEGRNIVGAYVGMSGWFPFVKDVERILQRPSSSTKIEGEDIGDSLDNSFTFDDGSDRGEVVQLSKPVQVVKFIRENIGLPPFVDDAEKAAPECLKVPVFLAHGALDEKLPIDYGRRARDALVGLGMDVQWKEYHDLGHWYKIPDEIDDIIAFLKSKIISLV